MKALRMKGTDGKDLEVKSKETNSNKDEVKRRIANDTQFSNPKSWDPPSRTTENGGR